MGIDCVAISSFSRQMSLPTCSYTKLNTRVSYHVFLPCVILICLAGGVRPPGGAPLPPAGFRPPVPGGPPGGPPGGLPGVPPGQPAGLTAGVASMNLGSPLVS